MELIKIFVRDTFHFCIGLLGCFYLYFIGLTIKESIEGLVDWFGNKIDTIRKYIAVRK